MLIAVDLVSILVVVRSYSYVSALTFSVAIIDINVLLNAGLIYLTALTLVPVVGFIEC